MLASPIRLAYDLAKEIGGGGDSKLACDNRLVLNGALLLLAHLCVDETFFSTGRTKIVEGMVTDLVKELTQDFRKDDTFLARSTYCLATVAFESIDPSALMILFRLSLTKKHGKDLVPCSISSAVYSGRMKTIVMQGWRSTELSN